MTPVVRLVNGDALPTVSLSRYIGTLVPCFYKILPIKESGEDSLTAYMVSLRDEMLGFKSLVLDVGEDSKFLSLLSILQFLIDNPDEPVSSYKSKVFHAINICKKLQSKYDKV